MGACCALFAGLKNSDCWRWLVFLSSERKSNLSGRFIQFSGASLGKRAACAKS